MKGTIVFFLALLFAGIYYGLQPSEKVILKGIETNVAKPEYKIFVRSKGEVVTRGSIMTKNEPPYTFTIRIMPENKTVQFVELQDVHIYACDKYIRLLTYEEPLIHVFDYFDYRKPMALYELKGEVECHGNVIMDLSFVFHDANKSAVYEAHERILLEAFDYVPSTFGYWWSMAKRW